MPARRGFDHEAAYEYFYGELGMRRRMIDVAKKFEVRPDSLYKVAKKENWIERAVKRDKDVRSETDRKMVKTHAQRAIDNLKMIDAIKAIFARTLIPGGPNSLSEITPREMIEFIKLEQVLLGQPTSVPGESTKARTLEEIEQELIEMPDDDILTNLGTVEDIRKRLTSGG